MANPPKTGDGCRAGRLDYRKVDDFWSIVNGPRAGFPHSISWGEREAGVEGCRPSCELGRMKPVKRSIAFLVRGEKDLVLLVRRPPDDEDLPDAWGLPAGSLRPGESWEEAVRRAGREKLGVLLRPGALLHEGELERNDYRLRMRLYEATIEGGEPVVQQPTEGVTQYAAWAWDAPTRLEAAAANGSLCSRLALAWMDREG